ncbi:MAG TPA: CaiB/BaiF CoA-transferase family protein [Alphaproteobacteria bacterium]|nr:CaiB/BaiF CoA-transferase family protein [Alphaproteobacteria bacterium]
MSIAPPLSGIRVIDLSRVLGGPFATQILADHGADVLKIEPPEGDETRRWGPPHERDAEGRIVSAAYFAGTNRGKRGLSLDLSKPAARDVLLRVLEDADVLVENFRTGAMARWGLDYARDLKPKFPQLIYARLSGFGDDGPMGGAPGYDAVAQALTGLISINGPRDGDPVRVGVPIVDLASGMNIAFGVLLALQARHRTGEGSYVESTLFDTGLALLHPHSANWLNGGRIPQRTGSGHPNLAPYDLFRVPGGEIFLGVGTDKQFAKLAEILGAPELAQDARFKTNADRQHHKDALRTALEPLLVRHDAGTLSKTLLDAGVPAGVAAGIPEALTSPQAQHRGRVIEAGAYRGVAAPVRLADTEPVAVRPPPRFAEHTFEILGEVGYTEDMIEALIKEGAVVMERRS